MRSRPEASSYFIMNLSIYYKRQTSTDISLRISRDMGLFFSCFPGAIAPTAHDRSFVVSLLLVTIMRAAILLQCVHAHNMHKSLDDLLLQTGNGCCLLNLLLLAMRVARKHADDRIHPMPHKDSAL